MYTMPDSATRGRAGSARADRGSGATPSLSVRYWKKMRLHKVYPVTVSGSGRGDSEPVVVRVVMAGAQVVPAELPLDPSDPSDKATFYVTPIAQGGLRGERVEVLQGGRKVQEIRIPAKVSSQRGTLVWLFLAFFIPWLILHYFVYSPIGYQTPLNPNGTEQYVSQPWKEYKYTPRKDAKGNVVRDRDGEPLDARGEQITDFFTSNMPKLESLFDDKDILNIYHDIQDFPRLAYLHLFDSYHNLDEPLAFYIFLALMFLTLVSFVLRQEGRKTVYGRPLPETMDLD
jgi:hypothetical protein